MARFNPDLLLGDELSYEALLRDYPHESQVKDLRHMLRKDGQNKQINLDNLSKLDLSSEIQTCASKFYELQSIVKNIGEEESPTSVVRTSQRLEHLQRRVNNLMCWPNVPKESLPETAVKLVDTVLTQVPQMARTVRRQSDSFDTSAMQLALQSIRTESAVASVVTSSEPPVTSLIHERETIVSVTSPSTVPMVSETMHYPVTSQVEVYRTSVLVSNCDVATGSNFGLLNTTASMGSSFSDRFPLSQSSSSVPIFSSRESKPTCSNVSMFPSTSQLFELGLNTSVPNVNCQTSQNLTRWPNLSQTNVPLYNQSRWPNHTQTNPLQPACDIYSKITHPVEKYLAEIPRTNGLNFAELLSFFKVLLKLKYVPQLNNIQIFELLLTFVLPPLSQRIQEAIFSNLSIDQLHEVLIRHFIPTSIYEQMKRDLVHRVQGNNEMLAHYISEVRENSQVLRVNLTETEVVETILIGLSPAERSRLALMPRPCNFFQLEQLCIHSANVWFSDKQRSGQPNPRPPPRFSLHHLAASQPINMQNSAPHQNAFRPRLEPNRVPPRKPIVCYNCGEANHTSRYCQKPRNKNYPKNA